MKSSSRPRNSTSSIRAAALACAVVTATSAGAAHAGQPLVCKEAALAAAPTHDQLAACLQPAPISFELAAGYAIGGSVSAFARADRKLGPLWLSTRLRVDVGSVNQLDALGGLVLWDRYGVGWDTWSGAPSGGMRTVTSNKTVMRKALILAGGLKGLYVPAPDDPMATESGGVSATAVGGFQYHSVGGFRDHRVRELYALYHLSSGSLGGVLSWHEAIPPLGPFTIGAELGIIPTADNGDVYLALEVGYAFDR